MEKEFVPYELAVKLKALGFNEPCFGYYYTLNGKDWKFAEKTEYWKLDDEISIGGKFTLLAPLYQQAFRWFREKYDLQYNIVWNRFYDKTPYQYEVRPTWRNELLRPYGTSGMCSTYEEAELACLEKLIEIVENK
jgi:hypothetical protein